MAILQTQIRKKDITEQNIQSCSYTENPERINESGMPIWSQL